MSFTVNDKKFEHVVFITRDGCEAPAVISADMASRIERVMRRQPQKLDEGRDTGVIKSEYPMPVRTYERTAERRPGGVIVYREHAHTAEESAMAAMRCLTDDQRLSVMDSFCKHCGGDDPRCQCWNDD